jgi:hypothetical protein
LKVLVYVFCRKKGPKNHLKQMEPSQMKGTASFSPEYPETLSALKKIALLETSFVNTHLQGARRQGATKWRTEGGGARRAASVRPLIQLRHAGAKIGAGRAVFPKQLH